MHIWAAPVGAKRDIRSVIYMVKYDQAGYHSLKMNIEVSMLKALIGRSIRSP